MNRIYKTSFCCIKHHRLFRWLFFLIRVGGDWGLGGGYELLLETVVGKSRVVLVFYSSAGGGGASPSTAGAAASSLGASSAGLAWE